MLMKHNVFQQQITGVLARKARVFISHRQTDKEVARGVACLFEFLGLHYYFDEDDVVLQTFVSEGHPDARAIVESIDDGLAHSTHLLAVLSKRTMGSWWVPYEIGSCRARDYDIAFLILPSITREMLPEYVSIYKYLLWTSDDVFDWATRLAPYPTNVVHRYFEEWFELEGLGPFGELGPDEESVESWYREAEHGKQRYAHALQELIDEYSY